MSETSKLMTMLMCSSLIFICLLCDDDDEHGCLVLFSFLFLMAHVGRFLTSILAS